MTSCADGGTGTGVSHCPEPVYLVGAEVTDIPAMSGARRAHRAGLRRCGVERQFQPDALHPFRLHAAMPVGRRPATIRFRRPGRFPRLGTTGGAALLGRNDIGRRSSPGMAADLFAIDSAPHGLCRHAARSAEPDAKVGIGMADRHDHDQRPHRLGPGSASRGSTRQGCPPSRSSPEPRSNLKPETKSNGTDSCSTYAAH